MCQLYQQQVTDEKLNDLRMSNLSTSFINVNPDLIETLGSIQTERKMNKQNEEQLQQVIKKQQKEISMLSSTIQILEGKNQLFSKEDLDYKVKKYCQDLEAENNRLVEENKQLVARISTQNQQQTEEEKLSGRIEGELRKKCDEASTQLARYRDQHQELLLNQDVLKSQIAQLQSQVSIYIVKSQTIDSELLASKTHSMMLQQQIAGLQSNARKYKGQMEILFVKLQQQNSVLDKLTAQYKYKLVQYQKQNSTLHEQLQKTRQDTKEQQNINQVLINKNTDLIKQIKNLQQVITDQKGMLEHQQGEVGRLAAERDDMSKTVHLLRNEIAEQKQYNCSLRQETQDIIHRGAEREAMQKARYEEQRSTLESTIHELQRAYQRQCDTIKQTGDAAAYMQHVILQLMPRAQRYRCPCNENQLQVIGQLVQDSRFSGLEKPFQDMIVALHRGLSTGAAKDSYQQVIDELVQQVQQLVDASGQMGARATILKSYLQEAEQRLGSTENKVMEQDEQIKLLHQRMRESDEKIHALEGEAEAASAGMQQLRVEKADVEQRAATYYNQIKVLSEQAAAQSNLASEYKQQAAKTSSELEVYKSRLLDMEHDHATVAAHISQLSADNSRMLDEIRSRDALVQNGRDEIARLAAAAQQSAYELSVKQQQLDKSEALLAQLKAAHDVATVTAGTRDSELQHLARQLADLQEENIALRNQAQNIADQLASEKGENGHLKEQNEELHNIIQEMEAAAAGLKEQLRHAQQSLNDAQALGDAWKCQKEEAESYCQRLHLENSRLVTQASDAQCTAKVLRTEGERLAGQVKELRDENGRAVAENVKLQSDLAAGQKECGRLGAEVSKLTAKLASTQDERSQLIQQLQDSKQQNAKQNTKLQDLQCTVRQLNGEIAARNKKIEDLDAIAHRVSDLELTISDKEAVIQNLGKQIDGLVAQESARQGHIEKLQGENDKSSSHIKELMAQVQLQAGNIGQMGDTINSLNRQLSEATASAKDLSLANKRLQEYIDSQEEYRQRLEDQLKDKLIIVQQNKKLVMRVSQLNNMISRLNRKILRLQDQLKARMDLLNEITRAVDCMNVKENFDTIDERKMKTYKLISSKSQDSYLEYQVAKQKLNQINDMIEQSTSQMSDCELEMSDDDIENILGPTDMDAGEQVSGQPAPQALSDGNNAMSVGEARGIPSNKSVQHFALGPHNE